jgi:hypothetical protein
MGLSARRRKPEQTVDRAIDAVDRALDPLVFRRQCPAQRFKRLADHRDRGLKGVRIVLGRSAHKPRPLRQPIVPAIRSRVIGDDNVSTPGGRAAEARLTGLAKPLRAATPAKPRKSGTISGFARRHETGLRECVGLAGGLGFEPRLAESEGTPSPLLTWILNI